jgi:large subunit ribosomal protein L29
MASASDLAQLDGAELSTRLGDARRELFNLRFQLATGQLDNPARVGQVRHEVARILTVLRAREILEAEGAYVAPTAEAHQGALAKLAAEDAAVLEKAAARAAAAEAAESADHDHDHDGHTHDDIDDEFDDDELDDDDIDDDDIDDIDDIDDDERAEEEEA